MTLASAGIDRLAARVREPRTGGTASRRTRSSAMNAPSRTSPAGAHLRRSASTPPTAGTLWQTAQLVPLNAGPSPSLGGLDLEEVVEAETELLELDRRDAGQRIAGLRARGLRDEQQRGTVRHDSNAPVTSKPQPRRHHRPSLARFATTMTPRMNAWPAPQTASTRTCSGPAARGVNVTVAAPRPRFGISTSTFGADDAKAMRGVVARQANLESLAGVTRISDGVNENRSAATVDRPARLGAGVTPSWRGPASPGPAARTDGQRTREQSQRASSEPPSQPDVERVRRAR